jgi:WD40 repeat protein
MLAVARKTSSIDLYCAQSHDLLGTIRGPEGRCIHIAFSWDGSRLASSSFDDVRVWNLLDASFPEIACLRHENIVGSLCFSPDGDRVVTRTFKGFIRIWDIATVEILFTINNFSGAYFEVPQVILNPAGTKIFANSFLDTEVPSSAIRSWDASTGEVGWTSSSSEDPFDTVAVGPLVDRELIAAGTRKGWIYFWNLGNPGHDPYLIVENAHGARLFCLSFDSVDGSRLASGSENNVKVWDTTNGTQLFSHFCGLRVINVSFNWNSNRICCGLDERRTDVISLQSSEVIHKFGMSLQSVYSRPGLVLL